MKRGRLIIGAAAALCALVPAVGATASTGGGPVAQSLLGSGSDTTQFMMHQIDGLYLFSPGCQQLKFGSTQPEDFSCQSPDPTGTITTENYAHDQVHEAYFLGSGGGINQLCNTGGNPPYAHVDYARSSRVPGGSDCSGLNFVAYARDGISWEAFDNGPSSGVDGQNNQLDTCAGSVGPCLSQSQLQGIYKCQITNWSQVGGQNVTIIPYVPPASSGTSQTFLADLGNLVPGPCVKSTPENSNGQIVSDGNTNGAILPFSYGIYTTQVHGRDNAVLGQIDAVAPNPGTINSGEFPFGRSLFNVVCGPYVAAGGQPCAVGQSGAAAVSYVGPDGWICKPTTSHANNPVTLNNFRTDISNTISSSGFVPIGIGTVGGGDQNQGYCRLTVKP